MGRTITEKILAAHASKTEVSPDELINVKVDLVLANDITAPIAISQFNEIGVKEVFDRDKIALVADHYLPGKDVRAAEQGRVMREFAWEKQISHYYEVGRGGIEHALLPEEGLVKPGDLVIGADSHTCTYGAVGAFATGVGSTDAAAAMATGEIWLKVPASIKFVYRGGLRRWVSGKDLILYTIGEIGVDGARYKAMEFAGPIVRGLTMDERFSMANMAIEAGAKNGIIEPDDVTVQFTKERTSEDFTVLKSDPDAEYEKVLEFDVSEIEPQVALPPLPSNTRPVGELADVKIDQVVIGSCTNGRMEDLRAAAAILKGHRIARTVRMIVIPATQRIYSEAMKAGLLEIFVQAGGAVSTPTCGPCLGGHMGVLAAGEKAVATTNRNFVGRMGHPESEVYLASPAVAAASAVLGRIGSPDEL